MENIFSNILLIAIIILTIYSMVLYLKNSKYYKKGEGLPLAPIFISFSASRIESNYINGVLLVALVSVVYLQYENIELKKK